MGTSCKLATEGSSRVVNTLDEDMKELTEKLSALESKKAGQHIEFKSNDFDFHSVKNSLSEGQVYVSFQMYRNA